jgi:hypothetical protein
MVSGTASVVEFAAHSVAGAAGAAAGGVQSATLELFDVVARLRRAVQE